MQKLFNFFTRLINGSWHIVPAQTVDTLQTERDRLEKHLDYPLAHRKLTKTTTQDLQKYLDLAG